MSRYVDNFIKKHKEYFKRNESFIEKNYWDKSTSKDITSLEKDIESLEATKEKTEEQTKQLKELKSQLFDKKKSLQSRRASLFKEESEIAKSILNRLATFIKQTEKKGDRKLKKSQSFIDFTVSIISKHINKCEDYLDYDIDIEIGEDFSDDNEEEIDLRSSEIKFQDSVFQEKIKIQDSLESLNIADDPDNLEIIFFNKEVAALPMMFILPALYPEVKELTDRLELPDKPVDLTFHIHQKAEDIPYWDPKKHYWQQSKEALIYWYSEWLKMTNGFYVDGYYIHPWLYYHLNFFKTPMPHKGGGDKIDNPTLRDNEWFIAEQLKAVAVEEGSYYTKEGVCIYGSRRIAKSTTMSSIVEWRALVVVNISTSITSGSGGDLEELTDKIKTSMKYKVPAFELLAQKEDWEKGPVELGLKNTRGKTMIHSRHTIKNLESGSKGASQKTAGGAPSVYLIEEIGKFAWRKSYLTAIASFESEFGFKTIIIAVGTSGESSLSGDALKAVSNPKKSKFREMDWDLFESKIPKQFITWKRRPFATFLPGQMGYKTGFKRIAQPFGDFLGIESEYLNRITIYKTDWENNTRVCMEARELVKNDPLELQQEKVQYPLDPEECFLSAEKNIFPHKEAQKKKQHLETTGEWDRRRNLTKDHNGVIYSDLSSKPLAEYPHNGSEIDAPYLIFEDIPEVKPPRYVYVAGGDFYKQESSDTDSVGTIYIWKYDLWADDWGGKLVASYSARPSSFKKYYDKCFMLMEAYNAVIFPENEDLGGFQTYLERKNLAEDYIMPHIDFNTTLEHSEGGKRKYGWTAKQSKRKLLNLFANYMNESVETVNDKGEKIEIKRVQQVDDIYLLDEMIKFNPEGNFDRITACLGAIGYLHYLKKNYIYPKGYKGNKRHFQEQEEIERPKRKREKKFFRGDRARGRSTRRR